MPSLSLSVAATLAVSTLAAAIAPNVSCVEYTPIGWNTSTNQARINYFDNNPNNDPANGAGFHANTLPANATISHTVPGAFVLSNHTSSLGKPFSFYACNVTSLGLTTNTTQSSCSHGGCYTTYTNYVQIRNPATQHCLTFTNYNVSATNLTFQPCLTSPTTDAQYYVATQQVLYSPNYASVTSYGFIELDLVQNFSTGHAFAWSLDRKDNLTVEVVEAQYTQVGLSAHLAQV